MYVVSMDVCVCMYLCLYVYVRIQGTYVFAGWRDGAGALHGWTQQVCVCLYLCDLFFSVLCTAWLDAAGVRVSVSV